MADALKYGLYSSCLCIKLTLGYLWVVFEASEYINYDIFTLIIWHIDNVSSAYSFWTYWVQAIQRCFGFFQLNKPPTYALKYLCEQYYGNHKLYTNQWLLKLCKKISVCGVDMFIHVIHLHVQPSYNWNLVSYLRGNFGFFLK